MQNNQGLGAFFEDSELVEDALDAVNGGGKTPAGKGGDTLNQQQMAGLQNAMDQQSNFEKSLSNTLKKASDTSNGITSNMK